MNRDTTLLAQSWGVAARLEAEFDRQGYAHVDYVRGTGTGCFPRGCAVIELSRPSVTVVLTPDRGPRVFVRSQCDRDRAEAAVGIREPSTLASLVPTGIAMRSDEV